MKMKNKHMYTNKKKMTTVLVVISIFCFGCNFLQKDFKKKQGVIKKFHLEFSIPTIKADASLIVVDNKIDIFNSQDYTLYRLPYIYTLEKDMTLLKKEIKYSVFVFRNDKKFGFYYRDEFQDSNPLRLNIDSFLKERAFSTMDFYHAESVNLIQTKTDTVNIKQVFAIKDKTDEFQYDSIYVFYNKQAIGINYSLSKQLDTNQFYKLYKFNLVCSDFYSKKYKLEIPRREWLFELYNYKELSESDTKYFQLFINKLK